MTTLAPLAVLTNSVLLRQVVGFMRGVPLLLLELSSSLEKDEWSAYHGDAALVARAALLRDDRRVLRMLYDVQRSLAEEQPPAASTMFYASEKLRFDDVLLWAVRIGNASVLTWLRESFPDLTASAQHMDVAIRGGRVDILDSLAARFPLDPSTKDEVSSCALAFAPRATWLEVARWLHEHDYRRCFSAYVLERVVESGDVEMLRFLHARRPASFPGHMMFLAATAGNLEAVRMLRSDPRSTRAMDTAAQNGHLAVVAFLHEVRREACTAFAMDSAACNGFLNVVTFLHEKRAEGCTKDALNGAAQFGHMDVVAFLVENRSEGSLDEALERAERKEQHDVAKYLRARLQQRTNGGAQ